MHPAERKVRKIIAAEVEKAGAVLSWSGSDRLGEAIITLDGRQSRVVYIRRSRRHDVPSLIGRIRRAMAA